MSVASLAPLRVRRGLAALAVLAALYGLAAAIGSQLLPRRIWMTTHHVEVELLPPYGSLAEELAFLIQAGILPQAILVSGSRVLAGLLLGALVGVPLGLATARTAWLEELLAPWITFFRFTPALALLPLYVVWLGFGEPARILLIASGVAVVTLHAAHDGARGVSRVHLEAAAGLGASRSLVLRRVVVPAALPHVVAGLRIAVALAWVTIVAAELIRPTMPSLGYLLALAGAYPRVPTILIGLGTIGLLVLVSDGVTLGVYWRATRWMSRRDA